MATNRSRRLRKKLCVDEFQELGFEITLTYREGVDAKAVDDFLEAFVTEAMEAKDYARSHQALCRSRDCIGELLSSLKEELAPELVERMRD